MASPDLGEAGCEMLRWVGHRFPTHPLHQLRDFGRFDLSSAEKPDSGNKPRLGPSAKIPPTAITSTKEKWLVHQSGSCLTLTSVRPSACSFPTRAPNRSTPRGSSPIVGSSPEGRVASETLGRVGHRTVRRV